MTTLGISFKGSFGHDTEKAFKKSTDFENSDALWPSFSEFSCREQRKNTKFRKQLNLVHRKGPFVLFSETVLGNRNTWSRWP